MCEKKIIITFSILILLVSINFAAPMEKGPYLIFEGDNTTMTVLWQLNSGPTCTLEWGLDTSYSSGNVNVNIYGSDYQYKYKIQGLTPGTKYYYRVTENSTTHTGNFYAAPPSSTVNVKFLAFGDTRTYPSRMNDVTTDMISTYNSDSGYQTFCLLSGDWCDSDSEGDWDNEYFNSSYANNRLFQATVPVMGCMGNHEGSGNRFIKYMPYPFAANRYYSFYYGPVHIIAIDQYVNYGPSSAQYNWLENELINSTATWKFIELHAPGWTAGGSHGNDTKVQDYIQPLCIQYGVKAVFGGHNHYYSRHDVDGVMHITTGGGGAPLYTPNSSTPYYITGSRAYHFCKIDIQGNNCTISAVNTSGNVIDEFSMTSYSAPHVSITSPENYAQYNEGEDIIIIADAFDADGTVTKVEFYEDTTKLGEDTTAPFQYTWSNPPVGQYYSLTAKAIDDSALTHTSDPVIVDVNGADSAWILLTDDDFESGWGNYVDGGANAFYYSGTHSPQGNSSINIQDDTGDTASFYYANGIDVDGPGYTKIKVVFSFKVVSFDNSNEDFWLQYYDGASWQTVKQYAAEVDFDNDVVYTDETVYIYTEEYNFPADMKIKFTSDASGSEDDAYIDAIRVYGFLPDSQNIPPTVSITSPADGAQFDEGTDIDITADASDSDGSVTKVEFYQGSTKLGEDTTSPYAYTWSGAMPGIYVLTAKAFDDQGGMTTSTQVDISVISTTPSELNLEADKVSVGDTWTAVTLNNTYQLPVVICVVNYNNNSTPIIPRVRNASGNSFEVKLQSPSGNPVSSETVHYLVVEEGAWQLPDGRNIEAAKVVSDGVNDDDNWASSLMEQYIYQQNYTAPVIFGQVMTDNDVDWSVFWSCGISEVDPADSTTCYVGKHVGEDPEITRANETLGVIVIESGNGLINGVPYETAIGPATVQAFDNAAPPPFIYTLSSFSATPEIGIACQNAMNAVNGSWAYLYGANPISATELDLVVDEDQVYDSERKHAAEQVGYIVFESSVVLSAQQVTNEAPIAINDSYNVDQDTTLNISAPGVLENDTDPNNDPLTAILVTDVNNGTLTLNSDGSFTYTPNAGYIGSDSFTYKANDGTLDSNDVTVTITVIDIPEPPVANDDSYQVDQDTTLNIAAPGVLGNDTDPESDPLTAILVTDVANGTLTLNSDGSFDYTPNAGYVGSDSFTYKANDGTADSNNATVTITVNAIVAGLMLESGTVSIGDTWTAVTLINTYQSPVVICAVNYNNNSIPVISRIRNAAGNSFEVKLQNPSGNALAAETIHYLVVEEGVWQLPDGRNIEAAIVVSDGVSEDDNFSDMAQMELYAYQQSYTIPVVLGQVMTENDVNWSVFWTCNGSEIEPPDSITCYVGKHVGEDPNTTRANETLGIIVIEQGNGTIDVTPYEVKIGPEIVKGIDSKPPFTYTLNGFSATPEVGIVCQSAMDGVDGSWIYLYGANLLSAASMLLASDEDQVDDSERKHTAEQAAYIVFESPVLISGSVSPQPPVANNDSYQVDQDTALNIAVPGVLDNDTDINNDPLTAILVNDVNNGTLILNSDGSFDYTPNAGYSGTDSFTYKANDGTYDSNIATVTITVNEPILDIRMETGKATIDDNWTAITLVNTYISPVIVCVINYNNNSIPVVSRVRDVSGNTFEVKIQNPSGAAVSAETVHYLVVEEGVWQLPDGRNIEAVKVVSDGVSHEDNFSDNTVMELYAYQQSYTSPVVLGQVMTENDATWSTFWSSDGYYQNPPNATTCYVGKQVGEDPNRVRANETLAVIVIEAGSGTINGTPYEAALGADIVQGPENTPPFTYTLSGFSTMPEIGIAIQAGMDGVNGSWAYLYGASPLSSTVMDLTVDEDQVLDAERKHTTEQVAYIVFESTLILGNDK